MSATYLVSDYDIEHALYHLARLDGEEGWTRETLKNVIAANVHGKGPGEFLHVAGGVFAALIRHGRISADQIQVILLVRSIEGMHDDPNHFTVLSVGL